MICMVNEDQLLAYMLEELSLDQQLNFSKHIAGCTKCQQTLEELQNLQDAWEDPSQIPIPESIVNNIMDAIDIETFDSTVKQKTLFQHYKFKTVTHILIASAATVALIYSGVFYELPNVFASLTSLFADTTNSLHLATIKGTTWLYNVDLQFPNYIKPFNF